MKKTKEIQMEILEKYFTFEGKVATLKLVYDTFAELINPNFGDDKTEKLNDKLISDIKEAMAMLPKHYKMNLEILIKDFGNYTKEECESIIKQNVYLTGYMVLKENYRKKLTGWSLIGVGALILLASYLLRNHELWFDLINISGTLFVWEGVNTAFIERNMENRATRMLARTIQNITIEKFDKKA